MALFSGRSDDTGETDRESPWSSRGFVASVIVVAAIVVCGATLLVLGPGGADRGSTPPPTSQPTGPATPEPTGPPATAEPTPTDPTPTDPTPTVRPSRPGGGCSIPPGDRRIVPVPPSGVIWKFEAGILVPTKPATIGPGQRDRNGVLSCYAHSPIGSVFAAMATLAQVRDKSTAEEVIKQRVAPGTGQHRALAVVRAEAASPTQFASGEAPGQFVGYQFVDYTDARAVLTLAVQVDHDKIGALTVIMRWVDDDWKLELRSDGGLSDPVVLGSLDGFVRFRGS